MNLAVIIFSISIEVKYTTVVRKMGFGVRKINNGWVSTHYYMSDPGQLT